MVRKHWLVLAASAPAASPCSTSIFYTALNYTTAINVSIEQAAMPILIIVANFVFFRLRVNWAQIVGVVLTIVGVVLTACHGDPRRLLTLQLNFGDAIMVVAVFLYSGYSVGAAAEAGDALAEPDAGLCRLRPRITSLPFDMVGDLRGPGHLARPRGLGDRLLYRDRPLGIVAQIFCGGGLEMIGANRAGLFINLVPIFGTLPFGG